MRKKLVVLLVIAQIAALSVGVAGKNAPARKALLGGGLDGFESPYLGHNGTNDGAGGSFLMIPKDEEFAREEAMGLRWTFLPIDWDQIEEMGPTEPPTGKWASLDSFVSGAKAHHLNVFVQVVIGGNAGGPPAWAGRRVDGSSAPANMDALIFFIEKLVRRYRPGGTLATEKGWRETFGVRAWELDNEPDSYMTNWSEVADDYAEFVSKAYARIKSLDPLAVVLSPAISGSDNGLPFLDLILNKETQVASPTYIANGVQYAAGPSIDVPSFHSYELLDRIFEVDLEGDLAAKLILRQFNAVRAMFAQYQSQLGFTYAPKPEFWHTEGGSGYAHPEPQDRKFWVLQWFARAFSAGVRKVTVMDATDGEFQSVRTMTRLLPDPFPMTNVTEALGYTEEVASIFRVTRSSDGGWTYLLWAANPGTPLGVLGGGTTVKIPVRGTAPTRVSFDGVETTLQPSGGFVTLSLPGGWPYSEPVFLVDQARR